MPPCWHRYSVRCAHETVWTLSRTETVARVRLSQQREDAAAQRLQALSDDLSHRVCSPVRQKGSPSPNRVVDFGDACQAARRAGSISRTASMYRLRRGRYSRSRIRPRSRDQEFRDQYHGSRPTSYGRNLG